MGFNGALKSPDFFINKDMSILIYRCCCGHFDVCINDVDMQEDLEEPGILFLQDLMVSSKINADVSLYQVN
jgi:hypothetical protein